MYYNLFFCFRATFHEKSAKYFSVRRLNNLRMFIKRNADEIINYPNDDATIQRPNERNDHESDDNLPEESETIYTTTDDEMVADSKPQTSNPSPIYQVRRRRANELHSLLEQHVRMNYLFK